MQTENNPPKARALVRFFTVSYPESFVNIVLFYQQKLDIQILYRLGMRLNKTPTRFDIITH